MDKPVLDLPNGALQQQGFMSAVERWLPGVYGYFRRLGVGSATAEDLTQQTFLAAWQSLPRLRDPDRLKSWLYGIAYRHYLRHRDAHRAEERAFGYGCAAAPEDLAGAYADNPGSDALLARQSVREAVGRLPEEYRQPLVLLYWQDLSYQEAAKALSLPLGTLAWRVHKALKLMRQALAESEETDE